VKLAVEIQVPPTVAISTELLASIVGSEKVIQMLQDGSIYAGQRRKPSGRKKTPRETPATDAMVADAQAGLARAAQSFSDLVKGATE
jgi:hypothetical protein